MGPCQGTAVFALFTQVFSEDGTALASDAKKDGDIKKACIDNIVCMCILCIYYV